MQASRSARQPAGCALLSWCITEHLTFKLTVRAQPHASNLNSDSQATVEKGNNSVWLCLLCRVYRITMRKLNRHAGLQEVMGSPLAGEFLTAANQAIWAHSAAHTHRCWAHSATHPLRWLMDIATQGSSVQPTHKGARQVRRFAHVLLAGRQVGQISRDPRSIAVTCTVQQPLSPACMGACNKSAWGVIQACCQWIPTAQVTHTPRGPTACHKVYVTAAPPLTLSNAVCRRCRQ